MKGAAAQLEIERCLLDCVERSAGFLCIISLGVGHELLAVSGQEHDDVARHELQAQLACQAGQRRRRYVVPLDGVSEWLQVLAQKLCGAAPEVPDQIPIASRI